MLGFRALSHLFELWTLWFCWFYKTHFTPLCIVSSCAEENIRTRSWLVLVFLQEQQDKIFQIRIVPENMRHITSLQSFLAIMCKSFCLVITCEHQLYLNGDGDSLGYDKSRILYLCSQIFNFSSKFQCNLSYACYL